MSGCDGPRYVRLPPLAPPGDSTVHPDLSTAYLRWAFLRAALARGWWLATGLYLVVVAGLSPFQLILIGVFQGATVVLTEVPAGVLADTVSRRLSLVVAHVVMGAGMALTGVVSAFWLVVVSQCLWGLGWAFSSGADVAWITDELDRRDVIDRVLVAQGRHELLGAPVGIVAFGMLAWMTTLSTAIVAAGAAMVALGVVVVARWPETRHARPPAGRRLRASIGIFLDGIAVSRADRGILLVLAATLLVNGGAEGFGRLFARRIVVLGLPARPDPIVWFTAIALVAGALGAVALRFVEGRVHGADVARHTHVAAAAVGAVRLVLFAHAPDAASAVAASLLVSGIGLPATRVASTVLVNRRTGADTRATVHSLLSTSENLGEIVFGLLLAVVAGAASSTVALSTSAVLLAAASVVVSRVREHAHVATAPR